MLTILASILTFLGVFLYGVVIGWAAHRMHAKEISNGVGELATALTLVGGGVAVTLLDVHYGTFGAFGFGLVIGFIAPALVGKLQHRSSNATLVMPPAPAVTPAVVPPIPEPPESPVVVEEENPSSDEII